MYRYLTIYMGTVESLSHLSDKHYELATDGSLVILRIDAKGRIWRYLRSRGCGPEAPANWIFVPKNPAEVGLYMIATDGQKLEKSRVAWWTGDHWRTVGVRVDNDNRIPDGVIYDWEGPAQWPSDLTI